MGLFSKWTVLPDFPCGSDVSCNYHIAGLKNGQIYGIVPFGTSLNNRIYALDMVTKKWDQVAEGASRCVNECYIMVDHYNQL